MYKVFQVIEGRSEVELNLDDSRLIPSCMSGQIYDSDPVDFVHDLGARFDLHRSMLRMPGSSKLLFLFAKGVTSSLDALFLIRFGSQNAEYWQTLYSSGGLGVPFLILSSKSDSVAPYSTLCNFAQHSQDVGGNVKIVKWTTSAQLGHYKYLTMQQTSAIAQLLEQAVSVFSQKNTKKLGEKSRTDYMHDVISDLICNLQNAAVDSNQSFLRVALWPNDHFFLPSSSAYHNNKEFGSLKEDKKERSSLRSSPCMHTNSVLGQVLFNICVPKTVEGWDIKFSGAHDHYCWTSTY
ncbi:uncharacterized protein [Primulina eburnea]|uniref:uncharacterized protein n=1 Tax=Primulina eburnea TaxID=1245227 RepID=UPI003C6CC1D0